jgi:hypothetical protein
MAKFEKGKSGNPAGRPRGRGDRRTLYKECLAPRSKEIIEKAIDLALNHNNESILKDLLGKLLPQKAIVDSIRVKLRNNTQKDLEKVYEMIQLGEITPNEFSVLLNSIKTSLEIKSETQVLPLLAKLKEKMLLEK